MSESRFPGNNPRLATGETEDREVYTVDPSRLEYKPELHRDPRERTAWDKDSVTDNYYTPSPPDKIGDGIVVDLIEDYVKFKLELQDKLDKINRELGKEIIKFPEHTLEDVKNALEDLGFEEPFTFEDYTKTLDKKNMPAGDFLVELSEKQFENLEGNISMELYHDYHELLREIEITEAYLHRQSTNNMFSSIDTSKEGWEDTLLKEEKTWKEVSQSIKINRVQRENLLEEAFLFNQDNYIYQKELLSKEEPLFKKQQTQFNQLTDTMHIASSKLTNSKELFGYLDYVETAKDESELETKLQTVIHKALEPSETELNLTQIEQMLIVSTEANNKEKTHYKNTLRNVYNDIFLSHNLDELSVVNDLYENSIIPLTSILKIYNEPQDRDTTHFLETISSSMLNLNKEQSNKTKDFNVLNQTTYSLRMEKAKETEKKERERITYNLIEKLLEEIKEENEGGGGDIAHG